DHESWPCDRRRLVDDLWALGLANLPCLREYDAQAVARARLVGRELDRWRLVFGVALWLEEEHGVSRPFGPAQGRAGAYLRERGDLEWRDPVRVAIRGLQALLQARRNTERLEFTAGQLAGEMNRLTAEDDEVEEDVRLFTPQGVGLLLKRQRFGRPPRS